MNKLNPCQIAQEQKALTNSVMNYILKDGECNLNKTDFNVLGDPIQNALPMDYAPIINYELNTENDSFRFDMMTLGIPASYDFMKRYLEEHNIQEAVIYCMKRTTFLTKYILFFALIQNALDTYRTYGSLKTALNVINRSILIYRQKYPKSADTFGNLNKTELVICDYIRHMISKIRDIQREEKALETSVITGCSPIVPYSAVLKKPFIGEVVRDHPEVDPSKFDLLKEQEDEEIENEYEEFIHSMESWLDTPSDEVRKALLNNMMATLCNAVNMGCIMEYHVFFREPILDLNRLGTLSIAVNAAYNSGDHSGLNVARRYYSLAFLCRNWCEARDSDEQQRMVDFANAVFNPLTTDFSTMFNRVQNILSNASESALLSELDKLDAMDRFMKNPENYTATNTSTDPLELFDLTPLMNYIFTNRRFRTNQYTRSAFMDIPSIGGYTFYKGFLIVEPETPEGHEMNYLYIPVVDDLNGSQVSVIKYWRNGTIEVISESQFNDEIRG